MKVFLWLAIAAVVVMAVAVILLIGRVRADRTVESLWQELSAASTQEAVAFDSSMVEGLPAPARRYLLRSIAPGTPLVTTVALRMHGSMRLEPTGELLDMEAEQVLAPLSGFVWRANVSDGLMRIRGFDRYARGEGRMRWWLYGIVPVVSEEGADVDRSAAGRLGGEAVFAPATLLPRFGTHWEAIDDSMAVYEINVGDEPVRVVVTVDPNGRLQRVRIRRWLDDAEAGTRGYDAFDVDDFADERTFGGYTIPTTYRAGWRLAGPEAFPFFFATIDDAEYR